MTQRSPYGFTLVELLIATIIIGILAAGVSGLLTASLNAHHRGTETSELYREGMAIMDQIVEGSRKTAIFHIPNAHQPVRTLVAFADAINDDGDFYFGDTLFPRSDEDFSAKMDGDSSPGIQNIDDDGDGFVDDGGSGDDDEDGSSNEDPLDGVDNDGDGNIDEDLGADIDGNGEPGIAGIDDDADASVDEGNKDDDDEDGTKDEDPVDMVVYEWDSARNALTFTSISAGATVDHSERVTAFSAEYEAPERIRIQFTLTGDQGDSVSFDETVFPRNRYQRTGKRVR